MVRGLAGTAQAKFIACQAHRFGPHESLHRVAHPQLAHGLGAQAQAGAAAQGDFSAVHLPGPAADGVGGAHKAGHKRGLRRVVQRLRGADLLKAAGVHHRHMVRQHQGLGLVMGDVDKGGAKVGLQLLELNFHVLTQLQIQGTQGLVEQQQRGFEHQAACNRHPLLLPTRELVDALVLGTGKAHPLQHRADTPRDVGFGQAAPRQAIANVFADRHHGKQRQVLEHHVHRALVWRHSPHAVAADADVPGIGAHETGNHAQQRGLATARRAEDREKAAARHV